LLEIKPPSGEVREVFRESANRGPKRQKKGTETLGASQDKLRKRKEDGKDDWGTI